jgi:RimJ/RimL family protein N-acetyltransferase
MNGRYACMPRERLGQGDLWVAAVRPQDIESIRVWRNAQIDVLRQKAPISREQQQAYYATQIWPTFDAPEPANILLGYHEADKLIGYGGLVHIAWEHRRAEVSFLLDPARMAAPDIYERYFTAFLGLMKRLAFEDLGLERLTTETFAIRVDIIRMLEAAGFRHEGTLRRHVWINGRPVDSLVHGCLKADTP